MNNFIGFDNRLFKISTIRCVWKYQQEDEHGVAIFADWEQTYYEIWGSAEEAEARYLELKEILK